MDGARIMEYLRYILAALLVWNVIVFVLYGADKYKAKNRKRRISEKTLLLAAFFMGSAGACFGMMLFRHKTRHLKFKLLLPLFVVLNVAAGTAVYCFLFT
jgi:uncharacterized membrane protein YsdA (DUF1294 family)